MSDLVIIERKADGTESSKKEPPISKKKISPKEYQQVYIKKVLELKEKDDKN